MPDLSRALQEFSDTAQTEGWDTLFPALEKLSDTVCGHRLFSCSLFIFSGTANARAARVYSNDEVAYPLFGLKEMAPNSWTEKVIDRQETFVANSIEEIDKVFPDHEKIAALGLGSVINIPVIRAGRFIGTANLLDKSGAYVDVTPQVIAALHLAALIAFETAGLDALAQKSEKSSSVEHYS